MAKIEQTWVWGVPFSRVTYAQTLEHIARLVADRTPNFIVTANLHYAMLSAQNATLRDNNERAALVLADGMPIVWASRWRTAPLPERVAGSDLVPMLCERAAEQGYRLFFLGGAPGVGEEAARRMRERFPAIQIVGVESPPFRDATAEEESALAERIRVAAPDILLVAFGQPKGEYWVSRWTPALGVPVVMQVGATLDFIAGRIRRAPRWLQMIGFEWLYRFLLEPRRLGMRYVCNGCFAIKMMVRDLVTCRGDRR